MGFANKPHAKKQKQKPTTIHLSEDIRRGGELIEEWRKGQLLRRAGGDFPIPGQVTKFYVCAQGRALIYF